MSGPAESDGPGRGPEAPIERLEAAALRAGSVQVQLRGVRDAAHLDGLVGVLQGIRGVDSVRLRAYESVHSPMLVVHATRPIALAAELRSELGRQCVSCTHVDGRLEVRIDPMAPRTAARTTPPRAGRPATRDDAPPTPSVPSRMGDPEPPERLHARRGTAARPVGTAPGRGLDGAPPGRRTKGSPGAWVRPAADPGPPVRAEEAADHEALVSAEGVLRAVDELAGVSVLTFDTELRFVATAGALRDRPDHPTDLLGRRPIDIVGPTGWTALAPGYEGALDGRVTTLDTASADGRRRYEATFRPLFDGPRIIGGTVTLLDVTILRRDERMLAELREVFASSFDRSPIGQALLSPDGQWMRVNEALRRLVDRSDESLVGTYLRELTHHDDRAEEERLLHAVRTGERDGYDVEKRMIRGDGRKIEVHARVTAIRTDVAQLRGFIVHVDALERWPTGRR